MTSNQISAEARPAQNLFLETSAQIIRLVGGSEWRRGIDELISAADQVATSKFVLGEYEAVFGKMYESVADVISRLPYQHRPQAFLELWKSAASMLPSYVHGGTKLLSVFVSELASRYAGRLATPTEVKNFVLGQRMALTKAFFRGDEFFDHSSCCVWATRGIVQCATGPGSNCRLGAFFLTSKALFLRSVEIVASSKREESAWLKENVKSMRSLADVELIEFIGRKPGNFGDIIIFWETPDNWTILTRDKTFSILQKGHDREVFVYYLRLPRISGRGPCEIRSGKIIKTLRSVKLINYNSSGVCVYSDVKLGSLNSAIQVRSAEINGLREGRIVRVSPNGSGFRYGIRLTKVNTGM